MKSVTIFIIVQLTAGFLSVTLNSFLIYLVLRHTKRQKDSYQRIVIAYAIFDIAYSVIIALVMPVHYMSPSSWVIFSYSSLFVETPLATYGPSLDCTLFEIWLGFMVIHFIYRYHGTKEERIPANSKYTQLTRWLYTVIVILYVIFAFVCGFVFCKHHANDFFYHPLVRTFGLNPKKTFYTLIATKDPAGNSSSFGNFVMLVHILLLVFSMSTIIFCAWKIYRVIFSLKLVLVPMLFCYIPTVAYFSLFYTSERSILTTAPFIFTSLSSAVKFINPILVIACIREYREAARRIIMRSTTVDSSDHAQLDLVQL